MTLEEATIKALEEGFRDIDKDIDKLEDELYDLIQGVDYDIRYDEILDYVCDEEEFYPEDIEKIKELQQKLKELYINREAEYKSEIKDLPPKTNKTNFEGFDITKTDPPYDSYMLEGSPDREYYMRKNGFTDVYIAEMTPDEYLLLCGKYGWKNIFDNVDDIYDRTSEKELIDVYAERFKNGEKAPMPVLNVKGSGQEGRHRAFGAKQAGIKTIPVLIEI